MLPHLVANLAPQTSFQKLGLYHSQDWHLTEGIFKDAVGRQLLESRGWSLYLNPGLANPCTLRGLHPGHLLDLEHRAACPFPANPQLDGGFS